MQWFQLTAGGRGKYLQAKGHPPVSPTNLRRSKLKQDCVGKRLLKKTGFKNRKKGIKESRIKGIKRICSLDMQLIAHHSFLQLVLSWEKGKKFVCVSGCVRTAVGFVSTAEKLWPYRAAAARWMGRNVRNVPVCVCRIALWHPSLPSGALGSLCLCLSFVHIYHPAVKCILLLSYEMFLVFIEPCVVWAHLLLASGRVTMSWVRKVSLKWAKAKDLEILRYWSGLASSSVSASLECRSPRWNLSPCSFQTPPCKGPANTSLILEDQFDLVFQTYFLAVI